MSHTKKTEAPKYNSYYQIVIEGESECSLPMIYYIRAEKMKKGILKGLRTHNGDSWYSDMLSYNNKTPNDDAFDEDKYHEDKDKVRQWFNKHDDKKAEKKAKIILQTFVFCE